MDTKLVSGSNRLSTSTSTVRQNLADRSRGTAIVTGGRRGIGRATAIELAKLGFDVCVLDVVEDEASEITATGLAGYPVKSKFLRTDISDLSSHTEVIDDISEELGPITCLVNNAGIQVSKRGDLLDVSARTFDHLIGVNLRGTFFFTQAIAQRMLRDRSDHCSIITVTSSNAVLVSPEKGPYCISKAALSMANSLFAVRLAADDIPVFEIRPGLIRTDMTEPVRGHYTKAIEGGLSPVRRWGEPEEVGRVVASLATGALPFTTGEIINVGGGLQIARL